MSSLRPIVTDFRAVPVIEEVPNLVVTNAGTLDVVIDEIDNVMA